MIDIQKKGALFVMIPLLVLGLTVTACENTEDLVDPGVTAGTIVIDISPDDIAAPWELIYPDGSAVAGNGDTTLQVELSGDYQLNFGEVPGYGTPTPRSRTLTDGGELELSGTYVARSPVTGTVAIDANPNELVAEWFLTVDGKLAAVGAGDTTVEDVPVGTAQLIWNPVDGWDPPTPNPVVEALEADSLITFAGTYTPSDDGDRGRIVIRPLPEGIEAPWALSGPQPAGGVGADLVRNAPVGQYTLEWGEVSGYRVPKPSAGTLAALDSLIFETTYELATGTITIDPGPNEINAPWTLTPAEGQAFTGNGDTTLRDIPAGAYTLTWGVVSGWTRPDPAEISIFLGLDETRLVSGLYLEEAAPTGTVVIRSSPDTAPWSLSGPGFNTSGSGNRTFENAQLGDYTVIWQSLNGWVTPDPAERSQSLTAGQTISFVGAYGDPNGPAITGVSDSTPSNGSSITLTGGFFGSHDLKVESALGSDGFIESLPAGVGPADWPAGWAYAVTQPGETNYSTLTTERSYSGNKSIRANIEANKWEAPFLYLPGQDSADPKMVGNEHFEEIYVTWWAYMDVHSCSKTGYPGCQWKFWRIDDDPNLGVSFNDSEGEVHATGNFYPGGGVDYFRLIPYPADENYADFITNTEPCPSPYTSLCAFPNGLQQGNPCYSYYEVRTLYPCSGLDIPPYPASLQDQWIRWEVYLKVSKPLGTHTGSVEYRLTGPGFQRYEIDWTNSFMTHHTSPGPAAAADPGGIRYQEWGKWNKFAWQNYWDSNEGGDDRMTYYIDDIYLQIGNRARIEVGDASEWANCRRMQVQEPSQWSDGSITFDFDRGGFAPGEQLYVFVIRNDGTPSPGYPITPQ